MWWKGAEGGGGSVALGRAKAGPECLILHCQTQIKPEFERNHVGLKGTRRT